MKLIQEAALDDKFNVQMKKVQDVVDKLNAIIDESRKDRMSYLTSSQKMQLRIAADDFRKLYEKS